MTDFVYDEDLLIDKLEKLPARLRVIYAATCTERLFPAYERYLEKSPKTIEHNLEALFERLWLDVSGEPMSDSEVENGIDECMNEIQDINDSDWIDEAAEVAASSLCYSLRCRKVVKHRKLRGRHGPSMTRSIILLSIRKTSTSMSWEPKTGYLLIL
jgi:hypothetical protein